MDDLEKVLNLKGSGQFSNGRKDSGVMITLDFQFTKHVVTFSRHLQLQLRFFNGCTFEFYIKKVRYKIMCQNLGYNLNMKMWKMGFSHLICNASLILIWNFEAVESGQFY